MAWSPCGRQIATSEWGALKLWDVDSKELDWILDAENVRSIVYSREGKLLAVGARAELLIWDLAVDNEGSNPIVMTGTTVFMSAIFSQDEQTIAVACALFSYGM